MNQPYKNTMICKILRFLLIFISLAVSGQPGQITAPMHWWKESVFYEIYMPSFQDSDGNGYSDFTGMTRRLNYLQSLGIRGIWLTPFLKSPKVDNGYDVSDYYEIDTIYGNTEQFRIFLNEAHQRNIRVIMDMVINHTSTECQWFREAKKSKDNPFRNFYIWSDSPNNWESFFGGSAWEFDSITNQYYYHKFDKRMADLNWSNPKVEEEIQKVLRYWLDLGIDGFRFDVINFLTTDGIIADNPVIGGKQQHKYDIGQPGVKNAMRKIKSTVSRYNNRFVVGEIGSDSLEILRQYQAPDLMDVVFNFNLGSIPEFSVERIFNELKSMEQNMSGYPTLFFGSHDMPRMMNRLAGEDPERVKALFALILTAKGVPFIYYGDETGMQNITADELSEMMDIQGKTRYYLALQAGRTTEEALHVANSNNRDKSRSPMQWNDSLNAGFSSAKPWIKVHENFRELNVQHSIQQENSVLNTCKALITLRNKEEILQYGDYEKLELKGELLCFVRKYSGSKITVFINFGEDTKIDIPAGASLMMGSHMLKKNEFLLYRN